MSASANFQALALLALLGLGVSTARAQTYTASVAYTAADTADSISSYDWDGNDLYYATATPDFTFGGLYENSLATPVVAGSSDSAGASVVTIGNFVYYNTSTINFYNPANGTSTTASSATNYGLYGHNGTLYVTGAVGFGTNHIYRTALNGDGTLVSNPPNDLGEDSGSSGPLAFDGEGDLIYAPGYGDTRVLEWSAADVAAGTLTLNDATVLYDYTSTYSSEAGGTSMLVVGNQLLLTLTNFGEASDLLSFTLNADGSLDGGADLAYTTNDALGELRDHDGNIYVADGATIQKLTATPEPSTWLLLALGGAGLIIAARRRRTAARVAVALAAFALAGARAPVMAQEGPFSPAGGQPGSTGIAAGSSSLIEWANDVVSYDPGPVEITDPSGATAGGSAAGQTTSNALGPADATAVNPYPVVSLGDGGSITLSFATPIANGAGADFAVFENGFADGSSTTQYFLELATVAVSSDGTHFFTLPSISLTQTATQIAAYGTLDPTFLYNLAGSQPGGYGTPFDLSDLANVSSPYLNLNDITQVRVTDVIGNIGNINTALGAGTYTMDDATDPLLAAEFPALAADGDLSTNHVINDPYPTDSATGGFDLDAVGVINVAPSTSPEPATWLLLAAGAGALFVAARLRRA